MHMMDALSEAKGSRHLSHPITAGLGVLSFLSYHVCKVFVEGCCFPSHATSCRENERGHGIHHARLP